jgi:hypothetical protein
MLAAIGHLLRPSGTPPADVLEAYAHEVIPVLDRAEWLYQYWLDQSTLFSDGEKLGNVAAIHRWEAATMGRSLERVTPPEVLADAHRRVLDALELASRAAQLLSSGSRFHSANALCEGQSLLDTSRERRLSALRAMRRYLAPLSAPASPFLVGVPPPLPSGLPPGSLPPDAPLAESPASDGPPAPEAHADPAVPSEDRPPEA